MDVMTIFYIAVTVFCAAWSLFFLFAAFTGRAVANRGIRMSPRTLILVSVLTAWIGVVCATAYFPALAEMLSLYKGGVVFMGLLAAFIVSLAIDARR